MPGQKIVFGSKNQAGYAVHSFIPVGKDLFVQSIDSILPDEDVVNAINRVASRLRPRLEDEVPAEPGICIEAGFVPLQAKYERVPIGIRLKEFPDVHLSVDVHKNLDYLPVGSSPKLLREQAVEMAVAEGLGAVFARTKILRQNERLLGIWKGEEIALRTPAYKDALEAHEFREGGTRRLFKAGERMPHAVLLGEPGLWRNLTGSSRRQIQTIWKLVDYVDETATPPGAAGDAGSQASRPSDAPNVA
jgi:hypothetical protein